LSLPLVLLSHSWIPWTSHPSIPLLPDAITISPTQGHPWRCKKAGPRSSRNSEEQQGDGERKEDRKEQLLSVPPPAAASGVHVTTGLIQRHPASAVRALGSLPA
jgi:hypothetical protein